MSQERVGITVEVKGGEEALNLMRQLDDAIKKLNGTKIKINFGGQELNGLVSANQKVTQLGDGMVNAQAKTKTLGDAMRTTFNRISSTTMHVGQQMQVLGKTLTQISSPMRTLFRSTVWAGGFKMLNQVTEGMSKGFTRYDTMKKYPKIMAAFGYSNEDAKASIDRLDKSVRGLPTGLDEMVDMSQRFTATTGNIKKGTDLAIAANNAFLASMSTDTQKYQGMMQLQDVLGGKDMNAREWNSLVSSMTPAIVKMGESLGYTKDNMDEWITAVRSGEVANEDFIETLIKVGTEGGSVAKMAENSKDTWQAFFANVGNASSRMMAAVIESFDEVSKVMSGKDLNLFLSENVIGYIDQLKEAVTGWIRANPDYFINFLDSLKKFDWGGLVRGVGEGLKQTMDDIKQFAEFFGNRGISGEAMGRFFARAPLYGKILNVTGGFLKGMRGIIAAITTGFAIPSLMKKTGTGGGIFGLFGSLLGKDLSISDIQKARRAAAALPTVTQSLRGVVASLTGFMKIGGAITIISGSGFVAFKALKSMMGDLQEMVSLAGNIDWESATSIFAGIGTFFAAFSVAAGHIGTAVSAGGLAALKPTAIGFGAIGAITTFLSGIAALDMALLNSAAKSFSKLTGNLKKALDNISELQGVTVNTSAVKGAFESMKLVYNLLKPRYGEQGLGDMSASQAKKMSDVVSHMVDTIGSLGGLKDAMKQVNSFDGFSESAINHVKDIFKNLGEVYDTIKKYFSGTKGISVGGADNVTKIVESTKQTFDKLLGKGGIISQLNSMGKEDSALDKLTTKTYGSDSPLNKVKKKLGDFFEQIGEMYKGIAKDYGWIVTADSTKTFGDIMQNTKDTFDKLIGEGGLLSQLSTISETIPQFFKTGDSNILDIRTKLGRIFKHLGELYKEINEDYGWQVTGSGTSAVTQIVQNMSDTFAILLGEDGLIAQLQNMVEPLANLTDNTYFGGNSPLATVKEKLGTLFEGMGEIYNAFNKTTLNDDGGGGAETFKTAMEGLKEGVTQIQATIGIISEMQASVGNLSLGEGGSFQILDQIKSMITQLRTAFNSEEILALKVQIELFKASIESLKASLESIGSLGGGEGGSINIEITIVPTITGDTETVEMLNDARDRIEKARDEIKELSESINLSFPISASLPGLESAIAKIYSAASRLRAARSALSAAGGGGAYVSTGGYISGSGTVLYRAKGGDTMFRPRGTDTVPAMLTPGEYVTRKRAVDFFGIDFMQKINHLDVRGAIESLMARASGMSSIGRQTIVNNTYNNNSNVTINNASAGAGFTFKSASRFAGAF